MLNIAKVSSGLLLKSLHCTLVPALFPAFCLVPTPNHWMGALLHIHLWAILLEIRNLDLVTEEPKVSLFKKSKHTNKEAQRQPCNSGAPGILSKPSSIRYRKSCLILLLSALWWKKQGTSEYTYILNIANSKAKTAHDWRGFWNVLFYFLTFVLRGFNLYKIMTIHPVTVL